MNRRLRALRPALVVAGVVVTALAVTAAAHVAEPAPAPDLAGRAFVVTDVDGHDLVPGTHVVMAFEDGHLAATAGCNTLLGAASWDDGTLTAPALASTQMACTAERAEQDRWLAEVLTGGPSLAYDGTVLELRADGVTLVLEPAGV